MTSEETSPLYVDTHFLGLSLTSRDVTEPSDTDDSQDSGSDVTDDRMDGSQSASSSSSDCDTGSGSSSGVEENADPDVGDDGGQTWMSSRRPTAPRSYRHFISVVEQSELSLELLK